MAVAESNNYIESSCNCYKVATLIQPILNTKKISNLKDRYVLGEQLGLGQFGVIRVCSDKFTGEVLACKSIAKDRLVTANDLQSVKLEIEIMTRLSGHPNIVDLKAVYEEDNYVHLVMELCAGGELFHLIEKQGRFVENEARNLFTHLMQVVMYYHDKGIVHRDLKPENILLATKASSSPIKLADFGLATYINPAKSLHGTVGSPFYIAPEVLAGGYNQAADVWSAGVILYILLSGMPPFWGKTKSRIFDSVIAADLRFPSDPWDHISESAKDLIRSMLCTDPSKRFTAQEVLDHTWIKDQSAVFEDSNALENQTCTHLDLGRVSFSTSFMTRNQDISFGTGSPIIPEAQSPTFTCRSSFSSYLPDPSTPYSASIGFSFHSNGESNTVDFSTPGSSMPNFSFFSPISASSFSAADISIGDAANGETLLVNPSIVSNSSLCFGQQEPKPKEPQLKRVVASNGGSRILGLHNKRNNTIGLGEFDQIDPMVTESVIRWVSCTHLPTAPSLRSSLVC